MTLHITAREIALVFMAMGTLSVVLHEPLAKLDRLVIKGGPHAMEQQRLRTSSRMIIGAGLVQVALAIALIVLR